MLLSNFEQRTTGSQLFIDNHNQHRRVRHPRNCLGQTLLKARPRLRIAFSALFLASLCPTSRLSTFSRSRRSNCILAPAFFGETIKNHKALLSQEGKSTTSGSEGCQGNLTTGIAILVICKVTLLAQLLEMLTAGKVIIAMY